MRSESGQSEFANSLPWHRRLACAAFCLVVLAVLGYGSSPVSASGAPHLHPRIDQWTSSIPLSHFLHIVAGSQGSLWFVNNMYDETVDPISGPTNESTSQVESIDGSGKITSFPVMPSPLFDVARGPGGTWFVAKGIIGRVGPGGRVDEFPVHTFPETLPSLASGAGGYMWLTRFSEGAHSAITRISANGRVKTFLLPGSQRGPSYITRGTDGAMWSIDSEGEHIDRITAAGKITDFAVGVETFGEIAAGPEGDLWFGTFDGIARLAPSTGKVAVFPFQRAYGPLVVGSDGQVWFAFGAGKIGRMSPGGQFRVIDLPRPASRVTGLAVGPHGNIWYTKRRAVVGRIVVGSRQ